MLKLISRLIIKFNILIIEFAMNYSINCFYAIFQYDPD